MEAECAEYLESMSPLLKGQMGLILSNWSDAGNLTDIAPSGKCTATNQTCTSSSAFKSINISTTGSTEDPKKKIKAPMVHRRMVLPHLMIHPQMATLPLPKTPL